MKKIFVLFAFLVLASITYGQNSVMKFFNSKTITSDYALAGKDSITYVIQAQQDSGLSGLKYVLMTMRLIPLR
jgi:hypothetical protein